MLYIAGCPCALFLGKVEILSRDKSQNHLVASIKSKSCSSVAISAVLHKIIRNYHVELRTDASLIASAAYAWPDLLEIPVFSTKTEESALR